MSAGEHTQLLFHHGNRERRIFGNVTGKLISNRLKFLNGHQVIDDAETFGTLSGDRPRRKDHLFYNPANMR